MFAVKKIKLAAALIVATAISLASTSAALADGSYNFGQGYYVDNPNVTCETVFDTWSGSLADRVITVGTPFMMSPISNQQVSYQPILWRWNGSSWLAVANYEKVFGNTAADMPANLGFRIPTAGADYWRVSIVYRWYWNGAVSVVQHRWAGTHQLLFTRGGSYQWGATGNYCHLEEFSSN